MHPIARVFPALALAAVVAVPAAADFPQVATYSGTMKASGSAHVPGVKKQKLKDKAPGTPLELRGDLGTYAIHPNGQTITGPMAPGSKPGRYDVVQPTGQGLVDLISGTQSYFSDQAGIDVTISDVQVTGSFVMKKDGATVKAKVKFVITGTATVVFVLPFSSKATLKYKGPRVMQM